MTMVMNKRVLVTGARTGIGRAAALLFAKEGAQVAVGVRRSGDAKDVVSAIVSEGGRAFEVAMDVGDHEQAEIGIEAAVDQLGGLDILVANAGIEQPQTLPVSDIPLDEMNAVIDINLKGTWHCIHYATPHLSKPGGAVTLVSSLWGTLGGAGLSVYTSTKGGINAMTRSLAVELGAVGVRANCVSPGAIMTPMLRRFTGGDPSAFNYKANIPLERAGEPDEVAEAILWVSSERASYVTGQVIGADGGMPIKMSVAP